MSNNDKYLLRLYLSGLWNRIFTFIKKVNFECQMASVGLIVGTYHRSARISVPQLNIGERINIRTTNLF